MTSSPLALLLGFVLVVTAPFAHAQRPPEQLDSAVIRQRLERLSVVGSVLYLAAHPDDENTRLISCLANGRKLRTGYLSLTRGDGGQNLIGSELGDGLGILRTQELLEARRIDGGEQFFTRAVDFGFSKTPEETLAKWGHDEVLSDVVRVIRTFRPDVIVTRFATDGSGGHGHHTASALLANEAFDLAGDPHAFPDQIAAGLEPWKPTRLFFNASTWWNPKLADEAAKDPSKWVTVDVGGYDPLLGTSYTELAGKSRSQHKSQGFGAAETRGESTEYLRLEKGAPLAQPEILDGVVTNWTRLEGGAELQQLVAKLLASYDLTQPEASVPELAHLVHALDALAATSKSERAWPRYQAEAARQLILQAAGVVLDASAQTKRVASGETIEVTCSALQRRAAPAITWTRVVDPLGHATEVAKLLPGNQTLEVKLPFETRGLAGFDEPYWLANTHTTLFRPADGAPGILPVRPSPCTFRATLRLADGLEIEVVRPLSNTWVDRVAGQRSAPVALTPIASVEPLDPVALVTRERVTLEVDVEALADELDGTLSASAPAGWTVAGAPEAWKAMKRGERRRAAFELRRAPGAAGGALHFTFTSPKGTSDRTLHVIDHAHVPALAWYTPAEVRLVPLEVAVDVQRVGFLEGAGDDMPRALRRLGIAVERIDPATASAGELDACDAIVTGVRSYNTVPTLARFQAQLLGYVERGGTLLVQYNTAGNDLVLDARRIGPYPFVLTRNRVTVEDAPATLLASDHPLLSKPNRIGAQDFVGWVQERGLYFTGELDPHYTALLAWNDPGEAPLDGALITCEFGKGRFTYTGISLFRELPAGVPGAYRLLANLVSRRAPRPASGAR
ncbi:MAG: PIG-L family deacetylase [Planctomycetes bacterium]|nr:PIG-L family deacetylase [Planctomycetota bacterium]